MCKIKVYKTVSRIGSAFSAELVTEINVEESLDLQEIAEQFGGDLAIVDDADYSSLEEQYD